MPELKEIEYYEWIIWNQLADCLFTHSSFKECRPDILNIVSKIIGQHHFST